MEEELKPCPFCGSPAKLEFESDPELWDMWSIKCEGCTIGIREYATKSVAIAAWNRRPEMPEAFDLAKRIVDRFMAEVLNKPVIESKYNPGQMVHDSDTSLIDILIEELEQAGFGAGASSGRRSGAPQNESVLPADFEGDTKITQMVNYDLSLDFGFHEE